MSKKRAAEYTLTRDDDGEENADDDFVTSLPVADESEMSQRRVVKVRRPEGTATATGTGTVGSSGFFKDAAVAAGSAAPVKPGFGFTFGANASSSSSGGTATAPATFSFGATTATDSAAKPPAFGFPTAAPAEQKGFSFTNAFGTAPAASSPAVAGGAKSDASTDGKPAPTFSFGFSTSATAAPADATAKPTPAFSFGLPASTTTATADAKSTGGEAPKEDDKKPVFGAGTFSFNSAVNTFVAARNKMLEEAKDAKPEGGSEAKAEEKGPDGEDEDTPDPAGFGSEIVEQTARDVLATAPSKLYLFEKGEEGKTGRWVERGTGDAKLISQPKPDNAEEHLYRLLVRGGYSLNATIKKNTFTLSKTEAKHLILLAATPEGPHTYLLKFTGPSAEANTTKFSEALTKVVEEVSKAE